jgi:uncharacterized repeat protein (TIGR01451 family)
MLFRRFVALLLVVPFAMGITASDAGAIYIPGAKYSGPSSSGGSVSFTVTADGHAVTGFSYDYLPIGCGTSSSEGPRYETVAIANDSFSYAGADDITYTGTFSGPQTATGTLTWNGPYCPGQHPVLTWAASTSAPFLADLVVELSSAPDPVVVGSYLTYTTTVTDGPIVGGATAAPGVTLTEPVPAGTTFVSANASQGSCDEHDSVVTCALGTMATGATATVTVVLVANTAGEVDASASATSAAQEANADDNTATEQTTVQPLCVVPRVIGKTLAAAEAAIAGGHCRTGAIAHAYSKKARKGHVIAQQPPPGTRLLPSVGVVRLVVSRGPRPRR